MLSKKQNKKQATKAPESIEFHYIKSQHHRVIYCEGIIGSITPKGKVFFSLYSERAPIPKTITYELGAEGHLGKPIAMTGRDGLVRDLEVGVCMDIDTAKSLKQWLAERISEYEKSIDKGK